jgi:hypothetical protein
MGVIRRARSCARRSQLTVTAVPGPSVVLVLPDPARGRAAEQLRALPHGSEHQAAASGFRA